MTKHDDDTSGGTDAMSDRVLAVIPARYAAQRFPGKPLAMLVGQAHAAARLGARARRARPGRAGDRDRRRAHRDRRARLRRRGRDDLGRLHERHRPRGRGRRAGGPIAGHRAQPAGRRARAGDRGGRRHSSRPCAPTRTLRMGTVAHHEPDAAKFASENVVKVVVDDHDFALYFSRADLAGATQRRPRAAARRRLRVPPRPAAASSRRGRRAGSNWPSAWSSCAPWSAACASRWCSARGRSRASTRPSRWRSSRRAGRALTRAAVVARRCPSTLRLTPPRRLARLERNDSRSSFRPPPSPVLASVPCWTCTGPCRRRVGRACARCGASRLRVPRTRVR